MNKLLWPAQVLLTLAFGLFGAQKVVMAIPDLIAMGMLWIEDFAVWQVRVIGTLEVLAVLGLYAPLLVPRMPRIVAPLAAAGLAATMVGALATHIVRGDPLLSIIINAVLLVAALLVAVVRSEASRRGVVGAPAQ